MSDGVFKLYMTWDNNGQKLSYLNISYCNELHTLVKIISHEAFEYVRDCSNYEK